MFLDFDGWLIQLLQVGVALEDAAVERGRSGRTLRAGARACYEMAVEGLVDRGWDEADARELVFGDV